MNILFIGGTGRLSKDVVSHSMRHGNSVFLLTRGSDSRKIFIQEGYHMIYCDIRNYNKSREALAGYKVFDVVIDFLSFSLEQLKNTLDVLEGHYKQFIFISSATVFKRDGRILDESSERGNNLWQYAKNKLECEKYIEHVFREKRDVYYTIVRPYITYGNTRVPYPLVPRDNSKEFSFIQRIRNGQYIPVFNDGQTITTILNTNDFAELIIGLFENKASFNEDFNITDGEIVTWGQVLDVIAECLNIEAKIVNFTQKQICDAMPEYRELLLADKGIDAMFDATKINRIVPNYKKSVTLKAGITSMIDFYDKNPERKIIDYQWNGKIDRLLLFEGIKNEYVYHFPTFVDRIAYWSGRFPSLNIIYRVIRKIGLYKNN